MRKKNQKHTHTHIQGIHSLNLSRFAIRQQYRTADFQQMNLRKESKSKQRNSSIVILCVAHLFVSEWRYFILTLTKKNQFQSADEFHQNETIQVRRAPQSGLNLVNWLWKRRIKKEKKNNIVRRKKKSEQNYQNTLNSTCSWDEKNSCNCFNNTTNIHFPIACLPSTILNHISNRFVFLQLLFDPFFFSSNY